MRWQKPDADDIAAFMRDLPDRSGLGPERQWWPRWLYRSDHVENAARILNTGFLLSRARAEQSGKVVHDSASQGHIGQLTDRQRDYARLYFRPRTPTQYVNEGIRPKDMVEYGVQMPVPVYLLFSVKLLQCVGVEFTRGRLALGTQTGSSYDFLSSIVFKDVYHDGPVGLRRSEILNARHAEVIKKGWLDLEHLRHIVCRSSAERETLLYLLSDDARSRWRQRIIVDEGRRRLFFKRGTFLREVTLNRERIELRFYENTHAEFRGPFELRVVADTDVGQRVVNINEYSVDERPLVLQPLQPLNKYGLRITLNGDLAFAGQYDGTDMTDAIVG